MTAETALKNAIARYLKSLRAAGEPIWYYKVHGGPFQKSGVPDWSICYGGIAVLLEAKAAGGVATPLQAHTLREIEWAGGIARVVRSVDDVKQAIQAAKNKIRKECR
jgi:hypothetical protein